MILDKTIKTTVTTYSIDYYKSIGYSDIKCNQKIEIPVSDLPNESNIKVNVKCDVCGQEKLLSYQKYTKNIRKYNIYTCNNSCAQIKNKLTLKELYGAENFNRSEENKIKIKLKYDKITEDIEKRGYNTCIKCFKDYDLSQFLMKNGRYKNICRLCRNKKTYENRNKNPHIKAWRSVLKTSIARMSGKKNGKTHELLKYSPKDLKSHIEKNMKKNMSWDNYGDYWHIDHIVHVSLFKRDTPYHIVNDLRNLRPLEAGLNISRHNNIDEDCLELIKEYETYIKEEYIINKI